MLPESRVNKLLKAVTSIKQNNEATYSQLMDAKKKLFVLAGDYGRYGVSKEEAKKFLIMTMTMEKPKLEALLKKYKSRTHGGMVNDKEALWKIKIIEVRLILKQQ